jgi:sugar/nucleoside kinase (ribokinase family)
MGPGEETKMGILAVGSVALDSIKTPFGQKEEILGGAASYFSVAASYFADVSMIAVVGEDFPEEHLSFFRRKGIDTSGLQRKKGKTFRWKGEYESDMNTRTTLDTQLNVFADFSPELNDAHRSQEFLFLGNIDPELQLSVLEQMKHPRLVACDTMNYWIESKKKALLRTLSKTDLLIINDSEARQLANEANLIRAAHHVRSLGPKYLVIKRGEYGAILFGHNLIFSIPAFPVEDVLDPTGAGDSFAGGMVGYLAAVKSCDDAEFKKALAFGTVMASFSVMNFEPQHLGDLTFTEVQARYRKFRKMTVFEDIVEPASGRPVLI